MGLASMIGWVLPQSAAKETPAAAARKKLGLNGQQGEDLIAATVPLYEQGHVTDVYQVFLDIEITCDTFYPLQGAALRVSSKHEKYGRSRAEVTVRALAEMAGWERDEIEKTASRDRKKKR